MKVAIVYDSRTGTTKAAAEGMGKLLEEQGHRCTVQPLSQADPAEVSSADLICVGSWTQGLFIMMQHPTADSLRFIYSLGDLNGKKAVAFCTYKLATGSLLYDLSEALTAKGAEVVGEFRFRGGSPNAEFASFARTIGQPSPA